MRCRNTDVQSMIRCQLMTLRGYETTSCQQQDGSPCNHRRTSTAGTECSRSPACTNIHTHTIIQIVFSQSGEHVTVGKQWKYDSPVKVVFSLCELLHSRSPIASIVSNTNKIYWNTFCNTEYKKYYDLFVIYFCNTFCCLPADVKLKSTLNISAILQH